MPDRQTFAPAIEHFESMVAELKSDEARQKTHDQVEEDLLQSGFELLRLLMQGYLDLRSVEEPEGPPVGSDGVVRTHRRLDARPLMTIFGEVTVSRTRYSVRGHTSVAPLDGNPHQIKVLKREAARRGIKLTIVLDIIHVIEYLWKAAHVLFEEGDPAGETWVTERLRIVRWGRAVAWDYDRPYTGRGSACARKWDQYVGYTRGADIISFDIYVEANRLVNWAEDPP